jgi:hypothetical protein
MKYRLATDRVVATLGNAILAALVALTFCGVFAATASAAETRSLTSSADSQIVENAPTKNYGAATSLGVNGNYPNGSGKDEFALLKWDLSGIAPRTQVNSASVTLNVTTASPQSYQAYVLKRPWVESAVTWNVYSGGTPWQVAGAKGSLDREATVAGSITPSAKGKNTLVLPPAVVQGWVDNPATNQGIIIANPSSTRGFTFDSREATDPTRRPQVTLDLSADTTPPETTIDSGPSGTISSGDASFTFSSSEPDSTFECRLDGAAYSACTSPKSYTNLSNGSHTFDVRATDRAGNVDATPASRTFTVDVPPPPDTTPPETAIDSGPAEGATLTSGDVSFAFSSSEPYSTFWCSLDGGAYAACTSPMALGGLTEGQHSFAVVATDAAANTDPTPATRIFTVAATTTRVSVLDYGATPDDSTDDSTAFQRAMAAAVQGGGVAYVPAGTFLISDVTPPDHATLQVEAAATLKKYGTDAGPLFAMQGPDAATFATDVHVEGVNGSFTMDLGEAGQDVAGFRIRNVAGFSVKHMLCVQNDDNPLQEAPSSRKPCLSFLPIQQTVLPSGLYSAPYDGVLEDLHSTESPYGWGLMQFSGGQRIQITNVSSEGGSALRLENYSANWTPMQDITADGVTCQNGHDAVHMNPHGATHLGNIHITNVVANSCESAVSMGGEGSYGPDVTIDGVTATPGYTAQVRDPAMDQAYVGAWLMGPSKYCIDERTLTYYVNISNVNCGGLPNR